MVKFIVKLSFHPIQSMKATPQPLIYYPYSLFVLLPQRSVCPNHFFYPPNYYHYHHPRPTLRSKNQQPPVMNQRHPKPHHSLQSQTHPFDVPPPPHHPPPSSNPIRSNEHPLRIRHTVVRHDLQSHDLDL